MKKDLIVVGNAGTGKTRFWKKIVGTKPHRLILPDSVLRFNRNMVRGAEYLVFEECQLSYPEQHSKILKIRKDAVIEDGQGNPVRIYAPMIIVHQGTVKNLPTEFKTGLFKIIDLNHPRP